MVRIHLASPGAIPPRDGPEHHWMHGDPKRAINAFPPAHPLATSMMSPTSIMMMLILALMGAHFIM